MALLGGVGSGGAVAWTYSGTPASYSGEVLSHGPFDPRVPAVDTTLVSTSQYQRKIPGKVMMHDAMPISIVWDGSKLGDAYTGAAGSRIVGKTGTITVTLPRSTSGLTAGSFTGSGFFTSFPTPEVAPNGLLVCNAEWEFDGITGPTFTAEAA